MANTWSLALLCVITLTNGIDCKPVKRSATDCDGTDCIIPQGELDFRGNPRDTALLETITGTLTYALPEITDLLKNIGYVHQNTTVQSLPAIVQLFEDDKTLQESNNLLIENGTAVMTPILLEMVSLMQNSTASLQRVTNLLERQAEKQDQLLQMVAAFFNNMLPIQPSTQPSTQPPLPPPAGCISGLISGQHSILPPNTVLDPFPVVCDMDTDGGGWIVFQRRFDGSVDFDSDWNDYKNGFGSLNGEFWLGLDKLHAITSQSRWQLRVDVEDFEWNTAYAVYDNFRVGNNATFYRLDIGSYSAGTAGDSLRARDLHRMAFTTKDKDLDRLGSLNCAIYHKSGWWHNGCTHANLNGLYLGQAISHTGMGWYNSNNNWLPLKKSELKIRLI